MLNFLAETPMDSGYPNAVTLPVWNRFYRKRISAGSLSTHTACSLEDRARVAPYTLPVIRRQGQQSSHVIRTPAAKSGVPKKGIPAIQVTVIFTETSVS